MKCVNCHKSDFLKLKESFFVSSVNEGGAIKKPDILPSGFFCTNCGVVHWIIEDYQKIANEFEIENKKKNKIEVETLNKISKLQSSLDLIIKEINLFDKKLELISQDLKNENFTIKKINELTVLGKQVEINKKEFLRKINYEKESLLREINSLNSVLRNLNKDFESLPIKKP